MHYYETLGHFFAYFVTVVALLIVFMVIYERVTPHREMVLIRNGNSAAALQLVGTILGFTIPLSVIVSQSVDLIDVVMWGFVALVLQLVVFKVITMIFRGIENRIVSDCQSAGAFIGGISLSIGILQAGCMVP